MSSGLWRILDFLIDNSAFCSGVKVGNFPYSDHISILLPLLATTSKSPKITQTFTPSQDLEYPPRAWVPNSYFEYHFIQIHRSLVNTSSLLHTSPALQGTSSIYIWIRIIWQDASFTRNRQDRDPLSRTIEGSITRSP